MDGKKRRRIPLSFAVFAGLLALFFFQMFLLPARFYNILSFLAWPVTHNIAILVGLLLYAFFIKGRSDRQKDRRLRGIVGAIVLFGVAQFLCLLFNLAFLKRPPVDFIVYFISFYGPMLAMFVAYYSTLKEENFLLILKVFAFVAVASLSVSWLFMISDDLFGFVNVAQGRKNYMYRLFIPRLSATGLGLLCAITLPVVLGIFFKERKNFFLLLAMLTFATLVFTLSRWNIAVALVGITIFAFGVRRQIVFLKASSWLLLAAVAMGGLIGVVIFVNSEWMALLLGQSNAIIDRGDSALLRGGAMVNGLEYFWKRPIFGFGPGEIYVRLLSYVRSQAILSDIDSDFRFLSPYEIPIEMPHSIPIEILAENGVIGFAAFLFLIWRIARVSIKGISSKASPIQIGIATSVAVYLLTMPMSSFDNIMESWITFWFMIGLLLASLRLASRPPAPIP